MSEISEQGWIDKIQGHFGRGLVATGIGDDAAVIPRAGAPSLVVTTDTLNEGVHFIKERICPEDLGHKALAVNLSDLAAMGAVPRWGFLSVSWPSETREAWLDGFLSGTQNLAKHFGLEILGGDTNLSSKISITWTLLGEAEPSNIKYRQGARSGDILCVTKPLGDSAAGLDCLLKDRVGPLAASLLRMHLHPNPQVREGLWLAQQSSVHAMMDLSDGLWTDVPKLLKASGVGAVIQVEDLPASENLRKLCREFSLALEEFAVGGGEDYGLLFAIDEAKLAELQGEFAKQFGHPFFAIGQLIEGNSVRFIKSNQAFIPQRVFKHF